MRSNASTGPRPLVEFSEASTRVQEVAANMQQAAATRKRITGGKAEALARRYFAAIDARNLDEAVSLWADGGRENVRGQVDTHAPEELARDAARIAIVNATAIPAPCSAAILSAAVPFPPEMMAPAWPMRRPGGAVRPAMKPTTGFLT